MKIYLELFFSFFKIGLFTFGGGMSMLPMLESELIDKKKWVSKEEILDYFAIGQCTPGIIAVNTASFVGYFRKGVLGSVIATLGIISPSIIIISIIATFLSNIIDDPIFKNIMYMVSISVCVLIFSVIIKLFKASVTNKFTLFIFVLCFMLLYFLKISIFIIILISALIGYIFKNDNQNDN